MGEGELAVAAGRVLANNDLGGFTKPAPRQYPHQWNWDSALIAIGLAAGNLARAREEVRWLLRGQWRNGMVPHVVYHTGPSDYFPDPAFWQIERSADAPAVATSGITQPPILATAVRRLYEHDPDGDESRAFVREVYPALLAWHRWFFLERDPQGEGLVCIVHPWESGLDNSPRWDAALARMATDAVPPYRRRDTVHVAAAERPTNQDYDRFVLLIDLFRTERYDQAAILARSPFLIQDTLFNAVLYRANADLRALADAISAPTGEIDGWLARQAAAFAAKLWADDVGLYRDYDLQAHESIPANTIATLAPLYAGIPDAAIAARLVDEHLMNPAEYAPGGDPATVYSVPSASKNGATFDPRRYWRGPVWVNTNWLVIQGLRRYGYAGLAATLRRQTLDLVAQAGFREYFNPLTGDGSGSAGFSWSAALTLDLLAEADPPPLS
jgi:glycogen debranching enzyme